MCTFVVRRETKPLVVARIAYLITGIFLSGTFSPWFERTIQFMARHVRTSCFRDDDSMAILNEFVIRNNAIAFIVVKSVRSYMVPFVWIKVEANDNSLLFAEKVCKKITLELFFWTNYLFKVQFPSFRAAVDIHAVRKCLKTQLKRSHGFNNFYFKHYRHIVIISYNMDWSYSRRLKCSSFQ